MTNTEPTDRQLLRETLPLLRRASERLESSRHELDRAGKLSRTQMQLIKEQFSTISNIMKEAEVLAAELNKAGKVLADREDYKLAHQILFPMYVFKRRMLGLHVPEIDTLH